MSLSVNQHRILLRGAVTVFTSPQSPHVHPFSPICVCVCVCAGRVYDDHGLPALLLPGVVLLGADRGVAVLHGRDGEGSNPAHTQTLPLSRMG